MTKSCDFLYVEGPSKTRFRKGLRCTKKASAPAECRFASVPMMARGGREKASQRLNPNISLQISSYSLYSTSNHNLDNNPADDGKLFSDSHPYIAKAYAGAQAAVKAKVMPKKRQKTDEEKRILRERWEERRLYRENMAEVAKIMKMKVPTKHMDFDTANESRGNPKYLTGRSYQINCQSCVVANEMRRRGLTVSARPNTKKWDSVPYMLSYQTELIWIDPKTGQLPQLQKIYAMTETAVAADWARRTAEPGRYHLRFHWKSRGGHIITFERKEDGTGLFYDPHTGRKYQEDQFYYDRIKIDSLRFYRVDNLRVDTSMISGAVVKQTE